MANQRFLNLVSSSEEELYHSSLTLCYNEFNCIKFSYLTLCYVSTNVVMIITTTFWTNQLKICIKDYYDKIRCLTVFWTITSQMEIIHMVIPASLLVVVTSYFHTMQIFNAFWTVTNWRKTVSSDLYMFELKQAGPWGRLTVWCQHSRGSDQWCHTWMCGCGYGCSCCYGSHIGLRIINSKDGTAFEKKKTNSLIR